MTPYMRKLPRFNLCLQINEKLEQDMSAVTGSVSQLRAEFQEREKDYSEQVHVHTCTCSSKWTRVVSTHLPVIIAC